MRINKSLITFSNVSGVESGIYTPTWSGLLNVDAVTAYSCQYMRVGDTVTVSGWVNIDATVDNTLTRLSFSLPINAIATNVNFLNGTAAAEGGYPTGCIFGYTTDYGKFETTPTVDTPLNYSFHYTYRLS